MEDTQKLLQMMMHTNNELSQLQDFDVLLGKILLAARQYTNADAGTIYLVENNQLTARFVQNDTHSKDQHGRNRLPVQSASFPVNQNTISGYVASTGKIVLIKNAYKLPEHVPFKFNPIIDKSTNYRSVSMLLVPIKSDKDEVLGVIQVINKLSPEKKLIGFQQSDIITLTHFASLANLAMQRARFIRHIVLRMVAMTELHDPNETPIHVSHVADCAAELYNRWAIKHNIAQQTLEQNRDKIRMATLLHDIGKIAISDSILARQYDPELLSPTELQELQSHTWKGAHLFASSYSQLDTLVRTISMTHHERWDGTGYPGYVHINDGSPAKIANNEVVKRKGTEIPLSGRIVAIADAYDTMLSQTNDADATFEYILRRSGSAFDPELCTLFLQDINTIHSIYKYYQTHTKLV